MKIGSKAKRILLAALAAVLCLGVCFSVYTVIKQNKKSALVADANAATDVVGELYDTSNNTFSAQNLKALAEKAGYPGGISDMIAAAQNGTVKTAEDLVQSNKDTEWSVTLGGLKWNPMYMSQTKDGKAILTLWLAENSAETPWSDGTRNDSSTGTKTYTETSNGINTPVTVYSNSYDGSYIRHYVLNGDTNYATDFGSKTPISASTYDAVKNTFTPFRTSGGIGDYVVAPSNVQWQIDENSHKNDISNSAANYSNYWQNDKLWLPSVTEVYSSSGGLWKISKAQESNSTYSWLRSGYQTDYVNAHCLSATGTSSFGYVNETGAVRPALHFDLSQFAHAHSWKVESGVTDADGWKVTQQPDCTNKGKKERTCIAADCPLTGGVETEELAVVSTAHKWIVSADTDSDGWKVTTPATCNAAGVLTRVCEYNSTHTETDTIPQLIHEYETTYTVDVEPTCTTPGKESQHCKHGCGAKVNERDVAKLGHLWDVVSGVTDNDGWKVTKPATCTDDGTKERTCKRPGCGATETGVVTSPGHQYVDKVIDPDCTTAGYTDHTCSVCGDSYQDTTVPAEGHKYDPPKWSWASGYLTATATFSCPACKDEQKISASVTHDSKTASCTVAGDITHKAKVTFDGKDYFDEKKEAGSKLPHDSVIVNVNKAATCTDDGAAEYECKVCKAHYTDIIPALGHDFAANFTEDLAATCTTEGSKSKHCSRCSEKSEITVIPAAGHTAGAAADCVTAQTCTACGVELAAALGHDFGEWTTTKPATYTEEGEKRRECSRCDEYETEAIPTLGTLENEMQLTLGASFYYGDEIKPIATAKYGEVKYTWFDSTGAELTEKPIAAGTYKLVASVAKSAEGGYSGVSKEAEFVIKPRKITVTIDPAESEQSQDLAELTASVTVGTVLTGDSPYLLTTDADRETVGTYTITGTCVDGNYEITFVDGVYTVKERTVTPPPVDDPNTDPNIDQNKPNNNTADGDGFKLPDGFPLWQVIVGGLSIILIAAFIAKICSNVSTTKECKQKAAGVYAGAMVNGMLFGVSNMWWTVIALSLAGVALILFIVMLATGSAMKKARREEQRHHDEEMKMLMMMMHGKGGYAAGAVPAIDMDDLAQRVAAALLPTMQQTAAQITAGSGDYDDGELRRRIEELESKDDGFDDVIEVNMDELQG